VIAGVSDTSGGLYFSVLAGSTGTTVTTWTVTSYFSTTNFVHTCITVNNTSGQWILYKNGVATSTHNGVVIPQLYRTVYYIGQSQSTTTTIDAVIDDLRIYQRALNATEVSWVYNYQP